MWNIQLLGGLTVRGPGREVTRFRTQKASSLLAYLAFHAVPNSPPQPRETLIDMFWPEALLETGRHSLSNALSFLRHTFEPPGVPAGTVILADRANVRLNPAAVSTDVGAFEKALRQAEVEGLSPTERMALWLQAAECYQGSLLPGYYEEWIVPHAMRLGSLFCQTVSRLVPLLVQAGSLEPALTVSRRAVTADPLSGETNLSLMQVLVAMGQPSQALRIYQQLAIRLCKELGTDPPQALQEYARQLRTMETVSLPAGAAAPIAATARIPSPASSSAKVASVPALEIRREPPGASRRLYGGEFLLRTTTRFFDREMEMTRLQEMLSSPRTRLVTLTGSAGTGKTRLALEAAAHLVERTGNIPSGEAPESAVFVSLAEINDAGRLYEVILRALGDSTAADQEPLDQIEAALARRPGLLLILDNFEQLVEEGALLVRDLLERAATVKILITSRQTLGLEGEQEFSLSPLPTCAGAQTLEELLAVPSIALFVDRAQAALPDFQLTERNAAIVGQICDYLEGLPLAIELAAARITILAPARILEQAQDNRLDFLFTRRRDAASRQRTLRATLDWSYHLLPEPARQLLAQLSVYRGGWTLEAAEAIVDCRFSIDDWEADAALIDNRQSSIVNSTLELLTLLRDSSLIQVVDTEDGLRFTMLETIREYSQEKLRESLESADVSRRHRDCFLALAEEAELHLAGEEQGSWLERLEAENENLLAALRYASGEADAQAALRLAGALGQFWWVRGHWKPGRACLAEALEHADAGRYPRERAKALLWASQLDHSQGAFRLAAAQYEEAWAIYRRLGDKAGIASVLNGMGNVAQEQGDNAAARAYHTESLVVYRELGDRQAIALTLSHPGNLSSLQGDYEAAREQFAESLDLRRELGDKRGIADSLNSLGLIAKEQGDYDAARALYEESLAIHRELEDRSRMFLTRHFLGVVAEHQGDLALARAVYEEELARFRELGDLCQVAWTLHGLGFVAYRQGDMAESRVRLEESLKMFWKMEHAIGLLRSLERFAGLAAAQGQRERAVRLFAAAAGQRAARGLPAALAVQQECERDIAFLYSELGAETVKAVWSEGQAMTLEQALTCALEREETRLAA